MKTQLHFSFIAFMLLIVLLSSCSNTKNLREKQYLITRSKIVFEDKNPGIEVSELHGLVEQKLNKKFLGFVRFKLWAFNRSMRKKDSKYKNWLENTVGERPSILDTLMASKDCKEMEKYLGNVGYFYSDVNYSIKYLEKSKKAHIKYTVSPAKPYLIKSLKYEIEDPELSFWIQKNTKGSLIKPGKVYNVYNLDKERERITKFLNENGYYGFVKDYVFFEVDSSLNSKKMDLFLKVKNITLPHPDSAGKFLEEKHYRYMIDKVLVFPNYNPSDIQSSTQPYDTVVNEVHQLGKNVAPNYYYILYKNKHRMNPGILAQTTRIENGKPFNLRDVEETRKGFSYLSIYNYTNISFKETGPPLMSGDSIEFKRLEARVSLQRATVHQYSIEAEGTNSGGDLGIGGNITYRNRNIFRNGETFQFKLHGAMEAQRSNSAGEEQQNTFLFFNTFEWGVEAKITFPRFLIPVRMSRFPKYFRPTTSVSTGINFRKRSTYDRYVLNFTFGYKWQESKRKTHIIQPFNISSIKVYTTPEFTKELEEIDDPRLKNQYTDHLITAFQYSFIFNNQDINKVKDFIFFKADAETSGNIFYLFNNGLDSKKDSAGYYKIVGIRYAQYARLELDFRYYLMLSRTNQIVFRLLTGAGIPYGNSESLPFEKGFYLGGANSMRAWIYRDLGPGGFQYPNSNIDKMGDIVLESNIEYRFPIYSFVKGAVFYDVGNVWLRKEVENFPSTAFKFNTFYKQLAMDAGVGLRLDFKFFVFRVDIALRLRDPAQNQGDRWVANRGIWFWNFGIGYPF